MPTMHSGATRFKTDDLQDRRTFTFKADYVQDRPKGHSPAVHHLHSVWGVNARAMLCAVVCVCVCVFTLCAWGLVWFRARGLFLVCYGPCMRSVPWRKVKRVCCVY